MVKYPRTGVIYSRLNNERYSLNYMETYRA
nr:MAG TPA: hypothetical protein [Caudoviricetes sp.]DAN42485.1 MAG TPA: hypothetical protein [Caudoviricetes sp.]DAS19285.1 MAG TPA: hypothetical protein [Caudoviricetes sp.]DAV02472.1 MAG TPA: hypothetical protein [Caudoviricetes sp.]DAZ71673.1 MAG TPA: hypothetical protein [Caudoviricetes sp.]